MNKRFFLKTLAISCASIWVPIKADNGVYKLKCNHFIIEKSDDKETVYRFEGDGFIKRFVAYKKEKPSTWLPYEVIEEKTFWGNKKLSAFHLEVPISKVLGQAPQQEERFTQPEINLEFRYK